MWDDISLCNLLFGNETTVLLCVTGLCIGKNLVMWYLSWYRGLLNTQMSHKSFIIQSQLISCLTHTHHLSSLSHALLKSNSFSQSNIFWFFYLRPSSRISLWVLMLHLQSTICTVNVHSISTPPPAKTWGWMQHWLQRYLKEIISLWDVIKAFLQILDSLFISVIR